MNIIKEEKESYQMTELLLKMISDKTSGRKDFDKLEYEVIITPGSPIEFIPERCIYRNGTNSVKLRTCDIVEMVLNSLGNYNSFIPGRYRYCYYTETKNRRRWLKENLK